MSKKTKQKTCENKIESIEKCMNGYDFSSGEQIISKDDNINGDNSIDSSIISDCSDNEIFEEEINEDELDGEAREKYINDVVCDKIIKYVKVEKILKDKKDEYNEEIKPIKDCKKELEEFLLSYLDEINQEYINLRDVRYIKTVKETKAPIKLENIAEGLKDSFTESDLFDSDEAMRKEIEKAVKKIDSKREIKQRKYLKKEKIKNGETKKRKNDDKSAQSAKSKAIE